jgi:hypothetical protein
LQRIKDATQKLVETRFHEFFRISLPIMLYYENYLIGEKYLWYYKLFQDHLDGLNNNQPKYSAEELQEVIYERYKDFYVEMKMTIKKVVKKAPHIPFDHPYVQDKRHPADILT